MKNFKTQYPIEGTLALKPEYNDAASARQENIIVFPGSRPRHAAPRHAAAETDYRQAHEQKTLRGIPFNRMERWQAVGIAATLIIVAFGSLFFF